MPTDTPTPEQEFLARLTRAAATGASSGMLSSSGTSLDGPDGMRCILPDCPDPHTALLGQGIQSSAVSVRWPPPHPGWWLPNFLWRFLWGMWSFVREVSGDDAYERYLQHVTQFHPGQIPMSRSDHYKFRQEQKWDRLSRCC